MDDAHKDMQSEIEYVQGFVNREIVNVRGQKHARMDNRNRLLVYAPSMCPERFVESVGKYGMKMTFPDELGKPILYAIVSEKEWAGMRFDDKTDTGAAFFDERYYIPGMKNECYTEYSWEVQRDIWMEHARELMDLYRPSSFLDIGCAKGFLLKALFLQGVENVRGVDISQWAVDHCEPEVRGRVQQFDLSSGSPLPSEDGSFDVVNADSVMEHLDSSVVSRVMREMYRVSRKWVVISFPLGLTGYSRPWGDPSHKSIFCPGWWIGKAHDVGLLFDWRYSKFSAVWNNPDFIAESARLVFVKDRLDSDCPWDKLSIEVKSI